MVQRMAAEMRDARRAVLEQVAAGTLDPDRAVLLIGSSGSVSDDGIREVTVNASGVGLVVRADPGVATAVAEGPHQLRQDGDRLVLELPGAVDAARPGWQLGRFRLELPRGSGERVRVRVNPALPVRLVLNACDAAVSGLRADLVVEASASSVKVTDHVGAVGGVLSAGSAAVSAVLARDCALECDMGSLALVLLPGSDAVVTATAEMGSAKIVGGHDATSGVEGSGLRTVHRAVTGTGAAAVGLRSRMGSIKVSLP